MRGRLVVLLAVGALVIGITLTLVRGEARVWGDTGVFLSVGARLLDGDRLYADVADNKDPLFYYTYAGALWAGGVRGPAALDALWLALASVGIALMLRELRVATAAVVAGALLYPLALTAAWYDPGASMLPGLALAPWAGWLWRRGNFAAFGAILGLSVLFKANLALVVGASAVALLAFPPPGSVPRRRQVAAAAAGLAGALGVGAIVLAARGELRAYLEILEYNSYYSNEGLRAQGGSAGLRAHMELVRQFFLASGKWQWPAAIAAVVLFSATVGVGWRRFGTPFRQLSALTTATLLAAIATLALTALFNEHLQMLAYPLALGGATMVAAATRLDRRAGVVACAACAVFASWSSLKQEDLANLPLRTWTTSPISTPGTTLEDARATWFADAGRVPYAVFSRNSEDGHAAFIDDSMSLECRWFHQYPFYRRSQLDETVECARTRKPALILVTQSFYDPSDAPRWESFQIAVRSLLAGRYELVSEVGMSQVWKLR